MGRNGYVHYLDFDNNSRHVYMSQVIKLYSVSYAVYCISTPQKRYLKYLKISIVTQNESCEKEVKGWAELRTQQHQVD